jgi:hypothetical protein
MGPVFLSGLIQDMSDDGTAGVDDGRHWFIAPFAGKVKTLWVYLGQSPDAAQELTLRAFGGTSMGWIPNSSPIGVYKFDQDLFNTNNFVQAGMGFAVQSNGGGTVASLAGLAVEFVPA